MAPLLGDQPLVGEWDPSSRLFTVRNWVPGPAGAAAVDLGDGVELELDVASPTVLTSLSVEAPWTGDPRALPDRALSLLEALLGPVGTEAVLGLATGPEGEDVVTRQLGGRGVRTIGAAAADGSVLARVALAAMHARVDGEPLPRAAAALDAALGWRDLPGLLVPSERRGSEDLLVPLADLAELGDADLAWLDTAGAAALADLVRGAVDLLGPDAPPAIRSLVARVEAWAGRRHRDRPAAALMLPSPAEAMPAVAGSAPAAKAARVGAPKAVSPVLPVDCSELADPPPDGAVVGVRRTEFELEVRAPAQAVAGAWWARAHARDGTPLALAPFLHVDGRAGGASAARLLVPAAELRHAVLDVTATPAVPRRSPARAAFDDALDAGRTAARAERLDRPGEAAIHWERCARRHEAAGDPMRAGQADERAAGERHRRAGSGQRVERPTRLRSDAVAGN